MSLFVVEEPLDEFVTVYDEVTGGTIYCANRKHLAFPGWEGNLIIKISITVSNSEVVWIDILLSSKDNWTFLVELVSLI